MLFAIKQGRSFPVKVTDKFDGVETAGYDAIHASSQPPYGPHVKSHKDRVWGIYNSTLENVRVVDPQTEARLGRIQRHINQLRKDRSRILEDGFLTFKLASLADFNPAIVRQGLTKTQATAKLPKGRDAQKAFERGKSLARLLPQMNKVLK